MQKTTLVTHYYIAVRRQMIASVRNSRAFTEISGSSGRYHKEGRAVASELLKKGSISRDAFYGLAGDKIGAELLGKNIFAFHFGSNDVTFQSTLMKRILEEELARKNTLNQLKAQFGKSHV